MNRRIFILALAVLTLLSGCGKRDRDVERWSTDSSAGMTYARYNSTESYTVRLSQPGAIGMEVTTQAGTLHLEKVLMTCDRDNIGSAKSIMNNGGVLENEVINEDGVWEQRYWIDLERIPPVTTVYFVRHCQSEFSHRNDRTRPLTALGMEDSAAVAQVLRAFPIDAFYCSPYRRSLDTIAKAAQAHGLPIQTDERLRERQSGEGGNFGLKDDGDTPLRKRWRDFGWCEPGGESLGAVQERNIQALQEILSESRGKTLVIGTHGTALSTVLNYYRPSFGCEDFLRIVDWMPYIVRLTFDGQRLLTSEEIFHIDRPYQK